jgi:enamine deaminase RidA (YjgF/YER057c/UK114 family)
MWEPICGYSRAVRRKDRILVSGTTATHGSGEMVCPKDPAGQTVYILDKIAASISALGGRMEDVIRTRVYLANADDWEAVSRVHGRYFGEVRPANTLLEVSRLVGDYLVEIEAEAVVG